jgi:phosphoribosyl 1,2-cyclic phosphodiesterase
MNFSIIFIGTGASTCVPSIRCVLNGLYCKPCSSAFNDKVCKDKRNNVSIAIKYNGKCILIDCGKTMRESIMNNFPKYGISSINSIFITHGHSDAIGGLDDIRDLQSFQIVKSIDKFTNKETEGFKIVSGILPIYARKETHNTLLNSFPYLFQEKPQYLDEENLIISRRIALVKAIEIDDNESLDIDGFPIRLFPVYHGGEYISLGFNIGNSKFIYISDVKIIPVASMEYLKSLEIEVLVIDALNRNGIFSHCSLNEGYYYDYYYYYEYYYDYYYEYYYDDYYYNYYNYYEHQQLK